MLYKLDLLERRKQSGMSCSSPSGSPPSTAAPCSGSQSRRRSRRGTSGSEWAAAGCASSAHNIWTRDWVNEKGVVAWNTNPPSSLQVHDRLDAEMSAIFEGEKLKLDRRRRHQECFLRYKVNRNKSSEMVRLQHKIWQTKLHKMSYMSRKWSFTLKRCYIFS